MQEGLQLASPGLQNLSRIELQVYIIFWIEASSTGEYISVH